VARRIDDIDAQIAVQDRGAFGENRDSALALEIVAIHRALRHLLISAERAGLLQHGVDQRGLAMVDMGDNSDVAEVHGCSKLM
jgi:hypothetical protein